jgi:hypothetical protein
MLTGTAGKSYANTKLVTGKQMWQKDHTSVKSQNYSLE